MYKVDRVPFRCDIDLLPLLQELTVRDLFHIKSAFDPLSGNTRLVFIQKNRHFLAHFVCVLKFTAPPFCRLSLSLIGWSLDRSVHVQRIQLQILRANEICCMNIPSYLPYNGQQLMIWCLPISPNPGLWLPCKLLFPSFSFLIPFINTVQLFYECQRNTRKKYYRYCDG